MIHFQFADTKRDLPSDYLNSVVIPLAQGQSNFVNCKIIRESLLELTFIDSNKISIKVNIEVQTFDSLKQLSVKINFTQPLNDYNFDDISHLKFSLKEGLIKDWKKCIWIFDSQSLEYSTFLYTNFHIVENKLRSFINRLMISAKGITWWDSFVSSKLKTSSSDLTGEYKVIAPSFKNVDSTLLLLNTAHLTEIMQFKKMKWTPEYNEDIEQIIIHPPKESNTQGQLDSLLKKFNSQLTLEVDLWESLFSTYFAKDFINEWKTFCGHRNHIAHNKLIDMDALERISSQIEYVNELIDFAIEEFESKNVSKEQEAALNALYEEQEKELISYLKEISNLDFRNESEIRDAINGDLIELAEKLEYSISLKYPALNVSVVNFDLSDSQKFLTISSTESPSRIILKADFYIDDEEGASSTAFVNILTIPDHEFSTEPYKVEFINPFSLYNEESGLYLEETSQVFNRIDDDSLIEEVLNLIPSYFK